MSTSEKAMEVWKNQLPSEAVTECLTRINEIALHLSKRKVEFLCGAGMSRASKLPLASDISAALASRLISSDPNSIRELSTKYPLEAIAEAFQKANEPPALKQLIEETLNARTALIHDGHRALESLASRGYINSIYTTNFDNLLEQPSFSTKAISITDSNVDSIVTNRSPNTIYILHLHGTVDTKCLITESQTYSLETPLSLLFKADIVTKWFVWIGYSLSDPDLRTIYLSMRDMLRSKELHRKPFVVHPLESEDLDDRNRHNLEWHLANKVWDARGATFLPGKAEIFLPALVEKVRRIDADKLVDLIIKKRAENPDNPRVEEKDSIWLEARNIAQKSELGDDIQAVEVLAEREGVSCKD